MDKFKSLFSKKTFSLSRTERIAILGGLAGIVFCLLLAVFFSSRTRGHRTGLG